MFSPYGGVVLVVLGLVAAGMISVWLRRRPSALGTGHKMELSAAFEKREAEAEAKPMDGADGAAILETSQVERAELGPLAKLAPFGPVAISLIRLFDRDDVKIPEIARLLESDPSLASELLAVVNSPLFAFQGQVTSPGHGVTLLGVDRTKSLAATLAMRSMIQGAPRTPVVRRFWMHSIASATLAREFAGLYGANADVAHVGALLHELGRIGLLAAYPDEYSRLALAAHDSVEEILTAEHTAFGMDHCEAGTLLAKAWALPKPFQQAIAYHKAAAQGREIGSLVQFCCHLADDLMFQAIHHRDTLKPFETVQQYAPPALVSQLTSHLETAKMAVIVAIQGLDF
jgi:HD-like signal output (HDOD) protein